MRTPHDILGVSIGVTPEELKQAYRKKAMQLHPDRNPDKESHLAFIELTEAYEELLGNKKKKAQPTSQAHPTSQTRYNQQFTAEELRERMEWAKQYAKRKAEMEFESIKQDLADFKASRIHLVSKYVAVVSIIAGVIMGLDFFLPRQFEEGSIVDHSFDGIHIYNIETKFNGRVLKSEIMMDYPYPMLSIEDRATVEFTSILKEALAIHSIDKPFSNYNGSLSPLNTTRENVFTIHQAIFFILLVLLLPGLNFLVNKMTPAYYFLVHVNTVLPLIMIAVISIWLAVN